METMEVIQTPELWLPTPAPLAVPSKAIAILYGAANQIIGIGVGGAVVGMSSSDVIDNTATQFVDASVGVQVSGAASGVATNGWVDVYAYAWCGGPSGGVYTGGASGSSGAYTGSLFVLPRLGRIDLTANGQVNSGGPWSIAAAFGNVMPQKWGLVMNQQSGATLGSTGGAWYQGIYGQYTS
jgi:hypothetical protein